MPAPFNFVVNSKYQKRQNIKENIMVSKLANEPYKEVL